MSEAIQKTIRSSDSPNNFTDATYVQFGDGVHIEEVDKFVYESSGFPVGAFPDNLPKQYTGIDYNPDTNILLAVANNTPARIEKSIDGGTTWTSTSAEPQQSWVGIAHSPIINKFAAVSSNGDIRIMLSDDGINWDLIPDINDVTADGVWKAITYGNDKFVVIGTHGGIGGIVMTSNNGLNWASYTDAIDFRTWTALAFGNNIFVAVASNGSSPGRVVYSTDAITWTVATVVVGGTLTGTWNSIIFDNDQFVVISAVSGAILTSPDGINWTVRIDAYDIYNSFNTTRAWTSVAYGNGMFIAVNASHSTTYIAMVSFNNGVSWFPRIVPVRCYAITFANGQFVAVGNNAIMTSSNGITWTARTSPASYFWKTVDYANGVYVALGSNPPDDTNDAVAVGGISIFTEFAGTVQRFSMATNGNIYLIAVQINGITYPKILSSTDGTTWTTLHDGTLSISNFSGYDASKIPRMAYGDGIFATCTTDDGIATSTNGVSWSYQGTGYDNDYVGFVNGFFIVLGITSLFISDDSGITFNTISDGHDFLAGTAITGLAYGQGHYIAVTDGGGAFVTSNPYDWSSATDTFGLDPISDIIFFKNLFVIINGLDIYTSTEDGSGISWNAVSGTSGQLWESIATDGNILLAVASFGTDNVAWSPDGINWNFMSVSAGSSAWEKVVWNADDESFLFVSKVGVFRKLKITSTFPSQQQAMTSSDGITWELQTVPFESRQTWFSLTHGDVPIVTNNSIHAFDVGQFEDTVNSYELTFGNTIFLLICNINGDTYPRILTSTNGTTWTTIYDGNTPITGVVTPKHLVFGNGSFKLTDNAADSVYVADDAIDMTFDGETWTHSVTIAGSDGNNPIFYINGYFIVFPITGSIFISNEGTNYTSYADGHTFGDDIVGAAFGNGVYVAVDASGGWYVTSNPTNWNVAGGGVVAEVSNDIIFFNGNFIIATDNGLYKSTNGVDYTLVLDTSNQKWQSLATDGTRIVAVSDSMVATCIAWSIDGISWNLETTGEANEWSKIVYGNGKFIALSKTGLNRILKLEFDTQEQFIAVGQTYLGNANTLSMSSPDGITWTAINLSTELLSITYSSFWNKFIGVGLGALFSSIDGKNWIDITSNIPNTDGDQGNAWVTVMVGDIQGDVYADDITHIFVAIAYSGTHQIMYSYDGVVWALATAPSSTSDWRSVAFGESTFVVVAKDGTGNRVMTSSITDLSTWTSHKDIFYEVTSRTWTSIAYDSVLGLYAAVGVHNNNGEDILMTSPDAITWTLQNIPQTGSRRISAINGVFVATASTDGENIITSNNGVTWIERENAWNPTNVYMAKYADGVLSAVASSGINRSLSTTDGINWNRNNSITLRTWTKIAYSNDNIWVAISSSMSENVIGLSDDDGITWNEYATPSPYDYELRDVIYAGGTINKFVAAGDNGLIISDDGITWSKKFVTMEFYPFPIDIFSIAYSPTLDKIVAVGTEQILTSINGTDWDVIQVLYDDDFYSFYETFNLVMWGVDRFIAVNNSATYYSLDGSVWSIIDNRRNGNDPKGIDPYINVTGGTYNNGTFSYTANDGINSVYITSIDLGVTWILEEIPLSTDDNPIIFNDIIYNTDNKNFVVVGQTNQDNTDRILKILSTTITGVKSLIVQQLLSDDFDIVTQSANSLHFRHLIYSDLKIQDFREIAILDSEQRCIFYSSFPWIKFDPRMLSHALLKLDIT